MSSREDTALIPEGSLTISQNLGSSSVYLAVECVENGRSVSASRFTPKLPLVGQPDHGLFAVFRDFHPKSQASRLVMSDSDQVPADGIPPRFRTRAASNPQETVWQARLANVVSDHDAIHLFRRRVLSAAADLESIDGFLPAEISVNDGIQIDEDCILVFAESGDVVASARMISLERLQGELGEFLTGPRLAEQLGRDLVNVVWSQHLLIDPGVPEAAVLRTLAAAMSEHAIRQGWDFDICLCIEANVVRREAIGFTRLGIRVDRENKSPLEILYREVVEQPKGTVPGAEVVPPESRG